MLDAVALALQAGAQKADLVPVGIELPEGERIRQPRQGRRTKRQIVLERPGAGVVDRDEQMPQRRQEVVGPVRVELPSSLARSSCPSSRARSRVRVRSSRPLAAAW